MKKCEVVVIENLPDNTQSNISALFKDTLRIMQDAGCSIRINDLLFTDKSKKYTILDMDIVFNPVEITLFVKKYA